MSGGLRCRWCGKYVSARAEPTARSVRDWKGRWSTVVQMLCSDCSADWSSDEPWNQPVDPSLPVRFK
jgi:hypothetical protein